MHIFLFFLFDSKITSCEKKHQARAVVILITLVFITSKKRTASKMSYLWRLGLWSQSLQNNHSIEDYDYNRSPHKNALFLKTATMITVLTMITALFLRIAIMIAVLIECIKYENCDHDRSPHKKYHVPKSYRIVPMFAIFFIRLRLWSQYSQKCFILEPLWDYDHNHSSNDRSPYKMFYFWVF